MIFFSVWNSFVSMFSGCFHVSAPQTCLNKHWMWFLGFFKTGRTSNCGLRSSSIITATHHGHLCNVASERRAPHALCNNLQRAQTTTTAFARTKTHKLACSFAKFALLTTKLYWYRWPHESSPTFKHINHLFSHLTSFHHQAFVARLTWPARIHTSLAVCDPYRRRTPGEALKRLREPMNHGMCSPERVSFTTSECFHRHAAE